MLRRSLSGAKKLLGHHCNIFEKLARTPERPVICPDDLVYSLERTTFKQQAYYHYLKLCQIHTSFFNVVIYGGGVISAITRRQYLWSNDSYAHHSMHSFLFFPTPECGSVKLFLLSQRPQGSPRNLLKRAIPPG